MVCTDTCDAAGHVMPHAAGSMIEMAFCKTVPGDMVHVISQNLTLNYMNGTSCTVVGLIIQYIYYNYIPRSHTN